MYFDHGVCVPGVDGKFLKVSLTQCHPSNAWSVFLGFGGEGVVDVDVDTCGWRWMVLPGGFKYFLFLEISNPPWFFFGFHDPPIWGAYFFSKWVGWLGSNYQLDVDLFARFLTNSNSAGLNVTFSIGSGFESPGRCIIGWTMDETYVSLCESWIFDIQILWTFLGVWCVLQRFCFEHVASKIFPSQTTTWENLPRDGCSHKISSLAAAKTWEVAKISAKKILAPTLYHSKQPKNKVGKVPCTHT